MQADEKHLNRAGRWVACRVSGLFSFFCCLIVLLLFRHMSTYYACLFISLSGKSILTDEDIDFIARNTAMKREAVEIQYKTFLQKHPDGRISRKSFHMMMKECYPGQVLLIACLE